MIYPQKSQSVIDVLFYCHTGLPLLNVREDHKITWIPESREYWGSSWRLVTTEWNSGRTDCVKQHGSMGNGHHLPPTPFGLHQRWSARGRLCATSHQQQFQAFRCTHCSGNVWKHGSILECLTSSIWDPGCWLLLANTFLFVDRAINKWKRRGSPECKEGVNYMT